MQGNAKECSIKLVHSELQIESDKNINRIHMYVTNISRRGHSDLICFMFVIMTALIDMNLHCVAGINTSTAAQSLPCQIVVQLPRASQPETPPAVPP